MRPVSDAFLAAVAGPHTVAIQVEVTGPDGTVLELQPVDGSVSLDLTTAFRGTCSLTLADDGTLGYVPDGPTHPLTPFGSEFQAQRGVAYPDGTTELVSLGYFGIDSVDVEDTGDNLQIQVQGIDRSKRVSDAKFEDALRVQENTFFETVIIEQIAAVFPGIPSNTLDSELVTPFLLQRNEGDDRWDFCQDMGVALAADVFFDGDGIPTIRAANDRTVRAELVEGEDGVLLHAAKNWNRDGISNRIIVTGENSGDEIARAVVTIDDPTDPLYYFGPFGRVPRFEAYDFVLTDAQARDTATMLLERQRGVSQGISLGSVVNPALEPDDVVQITRERAGIDELHILDRVEIPLTPDGEMTCETRVLT